MRRRLLKQDFRNTVLRNVGAKQLRAEEHCRLSWNEKTNDTDSALLCIGGGRYSSALQMQK